MTVFMHFALAIAFPSSSIFFGVVAVFGAVVIPTVIWITPIYVARGAPHHRPGNRARHLGVWGRFGQCFAQLFHTLARSATATIGIWCIALLANNNDVTPSVAFCMVAAIGIFAQLLPRASIDAAWRIALRAAAICPLFICFLPFEFPKSQSRILNREDQLTKNNVKQVCLHLLNFDDQHSQFPPASSVDLLPPQQAWPRRKPDPNRPRHSWRTSVVVSNMQAGGQGQVQPNYDAKQPWDSKINLAFASSAADEFEFRWHRRTGVPNTGIVAVVGPGTIWDIQQHGRVHPRDVTDGTANTVAVVYSPVLKIPWTQPRDVRVAWDDVTLDLNTGKRWLPNTDEFVFVGFADGHVRWIPSNLSPKVWQAMLTRSGGEVVDVNAEIDNAIEEWWALKPFNLRARYAMNGFEWLLALTAWVVLLLTSRSRRVNPKNRQHPPFRSDSAAANWARMLVGRSK